jgi:hypothetical protein
MDRLEIFYENSPIGYFTTSNDSLTEGIHQYVPYRNIAHFNFALAEGGVKGKRCACISEAVRYTFTGIAGESPGTLEVLNFEQHRENGPVHKQII